jgi:phosphatidylglycerophosphatase C
MALVVFDLDGTISRHDTLLAYLLGFLRRNPQRWPRSLVWIAAMLRFILGHRDRGVLKAALMQAALGGCARAKLDDWTALYVSELLADGVFADALNAVAQHRAQGDVLVLMSASPDLYVPEIARRLGFAECICTGVRWHGDRFDGALTTPNRQGAEKARCFEALQRRYPTMPTSVYANSQSDFDHMALADEAWLINPSPALLADAKRKHFGVLTWR